MKKSVQKNKSGYCVILGTRPEIIKLAPMIRCFERKKIDYFIIHTGQHYSYEMDKIFFKDLQLPLPQYHFSSKSTRASGHADHTGRMMARIEKILLQRRPKAILVQGDTNTVLAGSLAAAKIPGIKIAHVEAGLRSYDRLMPEEVNRVLSDHVSDFLFAPTTLSKNILRGEGIAADKIFITGNTAVDSVRQNLVIAEKKRFSGKIAAFAKRDFFLLTLHRQENVDDPVRLRQILQGLDAVSEHFKTPILFPVHPRTVRRLEEFGLTLPRGVRPVPPVGFLEFLKLENKARLILTDSGGVQEEACILRIPCVTLRTSTERPETVTAGGNLIAGFSPRKILWASQKMMKVSRAWKNPFGDGRASERMLEILERHA